MKRKIKLINKRVPIPNFKNYEEEARFWDTHSVAPYWNDWKKVKIGHVAKNLSSGITIRFAPKVLGQIRIRAQQKGLGPTQLIRMWVTEKLSNSETNFRTAI